jgi:hypothetical protein
MNSTSRSLLSIAILALLLTSLSGCTASPPFAAQTALKVIFGERPIVYANSVTVTGFEEFWCVIIDSTDFYELASTQTLIGHDGGWNASLYRDKSKWEDQCGLVPDKYRNRLKGSVENEVTPLP